MRINCHFEGFRFVRLIWQRTKVWTRECLWWFFYQAYMPHPLRKHSHFESDWGLGKNHVCSQPCSASIKAYAQNSIWKFKKGLSQKHRWNLEQYLYLKRGDESFKREWRIFWLNETFGIFIRSTDVCLETLQSFSYWKTPKFAQMWKQTSSTFIHQDFSWYSNWVSAAIHSRILSSICHTTLSNKASMN